MATPSNIRSVRNLQTYKAEGGGVDVMPQVFWHPPKGINTVAGSSYIPPEFSKACTNLMLNRGKLRSRYGTEQLGDSPTVPIVSVLSFTAPGGQSVLLRLRTNGVDVWNGDTWNTLFGGLTGNENDRFTWTGWGDQLLICNGVDRIFFYNIVTGESGQLLESFPCRHLTSFGNRVIASAITRGSFQGNVVAWCAKNDNTDWTSQSTTDGLGAGYEDLLGSPGGRVDEVMGVFPISDEVALMIREFSIWQMSLTGDFNAPFRFSRITPEVGARSRHSIVSTPYGVVFVSRNDVILASTSGHKSIGEAVRDSMFVSDPDFSTLTGAYDPRRQEYRLSSGAQVWRYSFLDGGWTRDAYPYVIKHMSFVDYKALGIAWDTVVGTWEDQTETWDEMTIPLADEAMYFVDESDNVITRERAVIILDDLDEEIPPPTTDVTIDSGLDIQTGILRSASHLDKTQVIEVQFEYEAAQTQTLYFEYSTDDNASWTAYSTRTIQPTNGPTLLRVRKTLERKNIALRLRTVDLGKLTIHSFTAMVVQGARMNW